jgi:hypothetical protein
MLCQNTRKTAQTAGLFQMCGMPETLPYCGTSSGQVSLGYCVYILDDGVVKGTLV